MKPVIMLLDIDGTLVDTDAHLNHAMAKQFKACGVPFEPHEFFELKTFKDTQGKDITTMLFGAAWEVSYEYLKSKNPPIDPGVTAFRNAIIEQVTSNHDGVIPREDVIDMVVGLRALCALQNIGFTAIAVTNGARKEALANLSIVERAGLAVDGLVCADDVTLRKPHPEPYLKGYDMACDILIARGASPNDARIIALEDSPPGAKSATAAGHILDMSCYYIPTTKRKMITPKLTYDEAAHFFIEQDIATLRMQLNAVAYGRGTRLLTHARHGVTL